MFGQRLTERCKGVRIYSLRSDTAAYDVLRIRRAQEIIIGTGTGQNCRRVSSDEDTRDPADKVLTAQKTVAFAATSAWAKTCKSGHHFTLLENN